MTPVQMYDSFEHEVNRMDSELIVESHIAFYWLNEAIERFVKTRYSGVNPKGESVEETQKRIDDLRTLVKESITPATSSSSGKPNSFLSALPSDYMFTLEEEVKIQVPDITGNFVEIKRSGITESTSDTYRSQADNPYSEHVLHYETARPLRLFKGNEVELITDGNYSVTEYYTKYLKLPDKINLGSADCELPEHTHSEIVNLAVNLYLENVGDPRYPTNKSELIRNE